jgi:hypothetical protein
MHTRRNLPALLAVAAVISLAACGDDDEEPTATELTPATVAAAATEPMAAATEPADTAEPMAETTEPAATTEPMAETTEPAATTEPTPIATGPVMSMPEGSLPLDEIPGLQMAAEELLVGQTESGAEQAATAEGWGFRVVRRDGENLPMTMDYRPDRVNVAVEDDVVTEIVSIG